MHRTWLVLLAVISAHACSDRVAPTPPDQRATSIVVTPPVAVVAPGGTVQLSAQVRDQHAQEMRGVTVTWRSEAIKVAEVNSSGLVTAVDTGAAAITVTTAQAVGTSEITVARVGQVTVSPSADTLILGDTLRLSARAFDDSNNLLPEDAFLWVSSDTGVAVVDQAGLVHGVGEGTTTIAVQVGDGIGTSAINVASPDRAVLVALYESTNGPNWRRNSSWLTDLPLENWAWVDTDDFGRVTHLYLDRKNLDGQLPPELGNLPRLEHLGLEYNRKITGSIPAELGNLSSLRRLNLEYNQFTGEIPAELGNLGNLTSLRLSYNQLSGSIPPEIGKLANLNQLTLSNNQLTGAIPPELGNLGNLTRLRLFNNQLSGSIPPEIGKLANLNTLTLSKNQLTGAIPPELGSLAKLTRLYIWDNALTGTIPKELGKLSNLIEVGIFDNHLTGEIPAELADLHQLTGLHLGDNELTGGIPAQLGNLDNLFGLHLGNNALSGPIPPELGELTKLRFLHLSDNNLTGEIPSTLGNLDSLEILTLGNNVQLSGPLGSGFTSLQRLYRLFAGGTQVCVPDDPTFQAWLAGVEKHRIRTCGRGTLGVSLTQAVQSLEFPVPLVADEQALLRVFVTAPGPVQESIPDVTARFYLDGVETHVADIPGTSVSIPTGIDEGSLSKSANSVIPGPVVQPGLEMVVEIDPQGSLDPALGVTRRIPATGRIPVSVLRMPPFRLTVVPFLLLPNPDSSILELAADMAADPQGNELLAASRFLLPISKIEATERAPIVTTSRNGYDFYAFTLAARTAEGGQGHYLGLFPRTAGTITGAADVGGGTSVAVPDPLVIAHEFGHNMGLQHAPCGRARNTDPYYPQPDGSIGSWGYDPLGNAVVAPAVNDLMSYCHPKWISDYHFTNAIGFRTRTANSFAAPILAAAQSLLLWGGVNSDGMLFLEPAFVVDTPPTQPGPGGEYRLTGMTAGGDELFSRQFDMQEPVDADGSKAFAFAMPVAPGWADGLATITLSGPDGSVTLAGNGNRAMAILRDPLTGQVRGFFRDPALAAGAPADAAAFTFLEPGLELLYSRGIPDPAAWRR